MPRELCGGTKECNKVQTHKNTYNIAITTSIHIFNSSTSAYCQFIEGEGKAEGEGEGRGRARMRVEHV